MKKFTQILLGGCLGFSLLAQAEVVVIVHPSNNDALDQEMISKIFLGKTKAFPSAGSAVPLDLSDSDATKEEFQSKVLKKNKSQYNAYWAKMLFTGSGTPPKEIDSQKNIIELIKNNPNLIGYIDATNVTSDIKVVAKF